MAKDTKVKKGEVNFIDEDGNLCLSESYEDDKGVVSTEITIVEYAVLEEQTIAE